MPSLPAIDTKRKAFIVFGVVTLILFLLGILFGYLARPKREGCSIGYAMDKYCTKSPYSMKEKWRNYFIRSVRKFGEDSCLTKNKDCNSVQLPRSYVARHLNGQSITIDGRGDDPAWAEVPWSENFVDMRASYYPKPYLDTKFKIRWDDSRMYVLIYAQDTDLYGNRTVNDADIWRDNGVEVMIDADGSLHNFKQIQVNTIGSFADLHYEYSPYDGAGWAGGGYTRTWSAEIQHQVYTKGTVNTPGDKDQYWSVELAMNFSALSFNTSRTPDAPIDREVWFMQFGRSQWKLNVTSQNTYVKAKGNGEWRPEDYWSWQPCGTINLILPDRWGLVQFQMKSHVKKFKFVEWHLYRALFDMFNAMKTYKILNGRYTDEITDLNVPVYLLSRVCVEVPVITLTPTGSVGDYEVAIKSRLMIMPTAHIRSDRYVWFK